MRNRILIWTLSLFFGLHLSGCSLFSSSSDEDQETATMAQDEESGSEFGDEFGGDDFETDDWDPVAMAEGDGSDESDMFGESGSDIVVEDSFGVTDEYPDDQYDYGEQASYGQDDLFVDADPIPGETMDGNQDQDLFGSDDEPIVDTPAFEEDGDSFVDDGMMASDVDQDTGPQFVPVKKMKTAVYQRAGANINRMYIVRPGDNMESIADKLYAGSRTAEDLYNYNSHFRGKDLKVGDKIYYESPNQPDDQTMMTYYEDLNIEPQYYVSEDGDNIRSVSQQLLGHERSWMEVWATNPDVESKDIISGGMQLRYWPDGVDTQIAKAEDVVVEEEPEPVMPEAPEDMAMEEPEPIDDMGEMDAMDDVQEVAELDDPKAFEDDIDSMESDDFEPPAAAGRTAPPAPPRPMAPPAPPKPQAQMDGGGPQMPPGGPTAEAGMMDDDSMIMGALGGLLILAAIIMLIFIRRSRAKRVNFSQTQI